MWIGGVGEGRHREEAEDCIASRHGVQSKKRFSGASWKSSWPWARAPAVDSRMSTTKSDWGSNFSPPSCIPLGQLWDRNSQQPSPTEGSGLPQRTHHWDPPWAPNSQRQRRTDFQHNGNLLDDVGEANRAEGSSDQLRHLSICRLVRHQDNAWTLPLTWKHATSLIRGLSTPHAPNNARSTRATSVHPRTARVAKQCQTEPAAHWKDEDEDVHFPNRLHCQRCKHVFIAASGIMSPDNSAVTSIRTQSAPVTARFGRPAVCLSKLVPMTEESEKAEEHNAYHTVRLRLALDETTDTFSENHRIHERSRTLGSGAVTAASAEKTSRRCRPRRLQAQDLCQGQRRQRGCRRNKQRRKRPNRSFHRRRGAVHVNRTPSHHTWCHTLKLICVPKTFSHSISCFAPCLTPSILSSFSLSSTSPSFTGSGSRLITSRIRCADSRDLRGDGFADLEPRAGYEAERTVDNPIVTEQEIEHSTEESQIREIEDKGKELIYPFSLPYNQSLFSSTQDSTESLATPQEAGFDDEQIRALLASPRYLLEREASAERSQIYHSEREGLTWSSSRILNFMGRGKLAAWLSHQKTLGQDEFSEREQTADFLREWWIDFQKRQPSECCKISSWRK